ncbi:MAG: alpha-hydroxy-acid oxidizing protein [Candidatus Berkiella sp.]
MTFTQRQKDIYSAGFRGDLPSISTRVDLLEAMAQKKLSTKAFNFIAGGAGREDCLTNNKAAFSKWSIVPRVLTGKTNCSTEITLFNSKHDYPFLLAPIGMQDLAHKDAEVGVAKAASAQNIALCLSTQASTPMETVAKVMGNKARWFQLYWSTNLEFNESLVKRAQNCGCSAIVVTLDTQMLGWRTRDLDLASLPVYQLSGIAQYLSDPIVQALIDSNLAQSESQNDDKNLSLLFNLIRISYKYPGNFFKNITSMKAVKALQAIATIARGKELTWQNIVDLRKVTKLPIVVKGILSPADAKLALEYGIDGIIVSNHGGRQLSSCVASLDCLRDVAAVAKGKVPILMDSGIQGGDDIFKAIALGADAVMIGRPYLYALAIAGEKGVSELLQNLKAEFELTMMLSGCATVSDITQSMLRRVD